MAQLKDGVPFTAGAFTTGKYPFMMFGLPAAAFAIYKNARPERKKVVGGLMLSAALTSFLTGITEPLEFSFCGTHFICDSCIFSRYFFLGHALVR